MTTHYIVNKISNIMKFKESTEMLIYQTAVKYEPGTWYSYKYMSIQKRCFGRYFEICTRS